MSKFFSTDANHKELKQHLQSMMVQVYDFAKAGNGFPDLLVVNRKKVVVLIEVKFGKRARIKKSQMRFIGNYKGFVGFAENVDEAQCLANYPDVYALPQTIKDKIARYELTYKEKEQFFTEFKREIGL